jgi:glycosyltransferase involved in cell wall biosynthesis
MRLNLFANFGGHGGYQILSEYIVRALRSELDSSFGETVNLFPIHTSETLDPYLKHQLGMGQAMAKDFADVSLAVATPLQSLRFHGKKRVLYPMHEGTKLPSSVVKQLNLLDKVWVSSTFNFQTFLQSGVHESKLELLHAGVDTDFFHPLKKIDKHLPTLRVSGKRPITPADPLTFLQVGKFENRKASFETVHGFLKAMEDHPMLPLVQLKVKWSTTVRSRSLPQIKNELSTLFLKYPKAAQRISIVDGDDVDMVALYNNADCLLFPSRSEGIGLPLLEAMACGIPCITTAYGSLKDYSSHSANIVLPDRGLEPMNDPFYGLSEARDGQWGAVDFEDISDGILDVVESTHERRYNLSHLGRKHVVENFSHQKTGQRLLKLLRELS